MPVDAPAPWLGLGLSAGTLVLWSLSPFFFAAAGRRIGAYSVNLLRLAIATPVLLLAAVAHGFWGSPTHAGAAAWAWLAVSGGVGLALGDFFLYRSFVQEGPERTSQLMTLSPALTAALAWIFLKERLSVGQLFGMTLVLAGVYLATWKPRRQAKLSAEEPPGARAVAVAGVAAAPERGNDFVNGAWAGIWSAVCQALGTVLARQAFLGQPGLDALDATAIRVGTGAAILWAVAAGIGLPAGIARWRESAVAGRILGGTAAGPVLGMLCYVSALKFTAAGIVTTITFMSPLMVIPLGAWRYRTPISPRAALGTLISLAGVGFLGLHPGSLGFFRGQPAIRLFHAP